MRRASWQSMEKLLAGRLRAESSEITRLWVDAILQDVEELRPLPPGAVIDHMPEFLDALAEWVDGRREESQRGFEALAKGHALTRFGFGVPLDALVREYVILRETILGRVLPAEGEGVREQLVDMNTGIDLAVYAAVVRYAARRDSVRERFVAILGHDLRTPINAIALAAQNLRGEPALTGSQTHLVSTIRRATDRVGRMISDVMDFARGRLDGGIPAEPVACDMAEILNDVIAELSMAHPHRTFELSVHGDTRGAWDRDRVAQAMTNLVGNAVEHGRDPIRVSAVADDHSVTTAVSNPGPPIPAERLLTLFEPFHVRDLAEAPRAAQGLGLGLFIVGQIALAHGAICDVACADGVTTFTIHWPRLPLDRVPRPGPN
jgi:signal transduction histidine kinase